MSRIEKYLLNQMSDQEIAAFKIDLIEDPRLDQELQSQAAIFASFDKIREEEIRDRFAKKSEVKILPIPRKYEYWRYAAALAGIVILSTLIFLNDAKQSSEVFSEYYTTYPNVIAPSVRSETASNEWSAYNSGNFDEAYNELAEAHLREPENTAISFYLGISAIETDRSEQAIEVFKSLQQTDHQFSEQSSWYLALAYLKNGQEQSAISELKSIPKGSSYSARVQEILDELN